jgi:hypothetical protein
MELRREECRLLGARERAGRGGQGEPGLEGQVEEARARLGRARDNRWAGAPSALPAAAGCVQFPRLMQASSCRLVQEEDTVRLYYSTENTRKYKEVEEQFLEVGVELAPAVEQLVTAYPAGTEVEDLPALLEERMKAVWTQGVRGVPFRWVNGWHEYIMVCCYWMTIALLVKSTPEPLGKTARGRRKLPLVRMRACRWSGCAPCACGTLRWSGRRRKQDRWTWET